MVNREDIIRWTKESGMTLGYPFTWESLEHFAALVAATEREACLEMVGILVEAEREACAKVVEQYTGAWNDEGYALAQAIRARGQA